MNASRLPRLASAACILFVTLSSMASAAPPAASTKPAASKMTAAKPAAPPKAKGVFNAADFDTTCAPCRDFDQFASGGWLKNTKLPPAYSEYGAFDELYDRNQIVLLDILNGAAKNRAAEAGTDSRKLGEYYSACMDSNAAEAAGLQPIQPLLSAVDQVKSVGDVASQVAWQNAHGMQTLFWFRSMPDPKNSDLVIGWASQAGIGLPDRDYYVRQDSAAVATREVYRATTAGLLKLAGEPAATADKHATAILELERALALVSMTAVERRDPKATYNKMPLGSLKALAPTFGWDAYLQARNTNPDSVNVTQPRFFRGVDSLLKAVPIDTWQAYLRSKVLWEAAPTLSTPFVTEWFTLRRALTGAKEMRPRWKRCLTDADEDLGEILGREYVERKFTATDKARMMTMIENLEAAMADRIRAADWMGDATRQQALGKLHAITEKIGYPDTWRDYSAVRVQGGPHFTNRLAAKQFEAARNLSKIGKPVERGEWIMTPPTVNAYYGSSLNSINFPAGILQPPFFDPNADDATNYGAIGAVIGHELSHGFDDRGRQFDARGNLRDWWTEADAKNYKERAQRVVDQFNAYSVLDTLHVNGRLTLGENIADLGGLAISYQAMRKAYAGKPSDRIDGFSPEQRFFLGWARIWRTLLTDESMRTQVLTDPHSPPKWRVNGPLSNLDEFHKAFGCSQADPMVRAAKDRTVIW